MTLVCVPIFVESPAQALADAVQAAEHGADVVEFRVDRCFDGSTGSDDEDRVIVGELQRLIGHSPLPVILTCRPTWEGGEYDGDDADRVALFEKLTAASPTPPAYLDVELAAYTRSANLRQKINLCVAHEKQERDVPTRLILSTHDFQGRPSDLTRKLAAAYAEPAAAIVKVAFRARSLRDNLELFDLLESPPKPTIALGMGEFGLMSRVLAPKFGGFLTFASLRDQAATAPGQPTLSELLNLYRFRSISKSTRVYGVIGWPVTQSMSPLIHNAGFAEVGHDGVYLPLPVMAEPGDAEASYTSFKATLGALVEDKGFGVCGLSVTIPHKESLLRYAAESGWDDTGAEFLGAMNTLYRRRDEFVSGWSTLNTDVGAVFALAADVFGEQDLNGRRVAVVGSGGVGRAVAAYLAEDVARITVYNRTRARAEQAVAEMTASLRDRLTWDIGVASIEQLTESSHDVYINCTPLGMTGGPGPSALSIPIPDMPNVTEDTVFFDTVYNPIETPMLRAAKKRGCRTIDGVQMFVKQAAAQFELWTGRPAPEALFDRLVRAELDS
ncbi:MAG: type I 3-dehydroquinate dehydratase [Planctomycetota bacterium]